MKKCTRTFLWFPRHEWEQVDIAEDRKVIGKVPDEWKEGVYKVIVVTTETFRCKYCGQIKTDTQKKEEVHRQFYR